MKKSTKTIIIVAVVLIAVIGVLSLAGVLTNSARKKTTSEFFGYAGITVEESAGGEVVYKFNKDNCKFDSILIDTYTIKGLKDGKVLYTTYRDIYAATTEKEIALLKANGIAYDCADPNSGSFWSSLIMPTIMLVLGVLVFMFLMRRKRRDGLR